MKFEKSDFESIPDFFYPIHNPLTEIYLLNLTNDF